MSILFVANLDESVTSDHLELLFASYSFSACTLMRNKKTGRSRGFALIDVETEEASLRARHDLDGSLFAGKVISVLETRAIGRLKKAISRKVH